MYQVSWLLPEHPEIFSCSLDFQEGDKPGLVPSCGQGQHCPDSFVQSLHLMDGLGWMDCLARSNCICHLTSTPPYCPAHTQLFNTFPRLGAFLRLHRPVLSKIEEVRTILRTLLEERRPPLPTGGPAQSYVEALLQQGQVWAGPGLHQRRGWWGVGSPSSREGNYGGLFPICWRPLGVSVSSMRLDPLSIWSGH